MSRRGTWGALRAVALAALPLTMPGCGGCGAGAKTVGNLLQLAAAFKSGGKAGGDAIISPVTGKPCPFITKSGPTELTNSILAMLGGKKKGEDRETDSGGRPAATALAGNTGSGSQAELLELLQGNTARQPAVDQTTVIKQIQDGLAVCQIDERTQLEILRRVITDLTPGQRLQFLDIVQAQAAERQRGAILTEIQAELLSRRVATRTQQDIMQRLQALDVGQQQEFLRLLRTERLR